MSRRTRWTALAAAALLCLVTGCSGGPANKGDAAGPPQRGGSLTYLVSGLLGSWSRGLDPASAGAAPTIFEAAIFGGLFQLAEGGRVVPDMATGYKISDKGKTVTISLRKGVKFQDGTALDADAVAWNIKRDLKTPCVCSPSSSWPPLADGGITTPDDQTVVLHFTHAYAGVMNVFVGTSVNRIASPTAVKKMGAQPFRLKPVGAGPFQIVNNVVNSQIDMKRYGGYFKQGRPYLDTLVFKTIAGDQPAYQAIQAGQAQAGAVTSPSIIKQIAANASMTVSKQKGTSPLLIQLNTAAAPFKDKRAREAIYYATDTEAIRTHLYAGLFPTTQSFTGPGGLFYQPKVPGYRTFNLAKAKQLVSALGGLKVDLLGGTDQISNETLQGLQSQWQKAGIQVTIHPYDLPRIIQELEGKKWQAALQSNGAFDPGVSSGVPFRFLSTAPYSGVHDKALDGKLSDAAAITDKTERGAAYNGIAKYISDNAYAPFLIATAPAAVATSGVHGPGLDRTVPLGSVAIQPVWDQAWMEKQ